MMQSGVIEVDVRAAQAGEVENTGFFPQVEGLEMSQQACFDALLIRWQNVFAAHKDHFGHTNAVLHQIPTTLL